MSTPLTPDSPSQHNPVGIPPELRANLGTPDDDAQKPAKTPTSMRTIVGRILVGVAIVGFGSYQTFKSDRAMDINNALAAAHKASVDSLEPMLTGIDTLPPEQVQERLEQNRAANDARIATLMELDVAGVDGAPELRDSMVALIRAGDTCFEAVIPRALALQQEGLDQTEGQAQIDALFEEHCGPVTSMEAQIIEQQRAFAQTHNLKLEE